MPAISEVLLNSQSHSGANATPITVTSDPFKGDGYYGWGDGVHTIEIELTSFVGDITIQASLASAPIDSDWFPVPLTLTNSEIYSIDTTGAIVRGSVSHNIQYTVATTSVKIYNFTGNFVWVRAIADNWTAGTINRILFNH